MLELSFGANNYILENIEEYCLCLCLIHKDRVAGNSFSQPHSFTNLIKAMAAHDSGAFKKAIMRLLTKLHHDKVFDNPSNKGLYTILLQMPIIKEHNILSAEKFANSVNLALSGLLVLTQADKRHQFLSTASSSNNWFALLNAVVEQSATAANKPSFPGMHAARARKKQDVLELVQIAAKQAAGDGYNNEDTTKILVDAIVEFVTAQSGDKKELYAAIYSGFMDSCRDANSTGLRLFFTSNYSHPKSEEGMLLLHFSINTIIDKALAGQQVFIMKDEFEHNHTAHTAYKM